MAILPTRDSTNANASADINELSTEAFDKGGASQMSALTAEASPGDDDLFLMERDTDGALRKVKFSNLGGSSGSYSSKTASYVITDSDGIEFLVFTGLAADVTATLPTAADNDGRKIMIKNLDGTYKVTVDGEGAETIDGKTTIDLSTQYDWMYLYCNGTNWTVIAGDYKVNGLWYYKAKYTTSAGVITAGVALKALTYTIPADGTYLIIGSTCFRTNAAGDHHAINTWIENNTSQIINTRDHIKYIQNNTYMTNHFHGIHTLNKGDVIDLYVYTAVANLRLVGNASYDSTYWQFVKVDNL